MLNARIHGCLTTPCISFRPGMNCPSPGLPKIQGTAIHSESTKTTIVAANPIQRIVSSFTRGITGRARRAATMAGRKRISDSGQKAGWARARVGASPMSVVR